MSWLWRRWPALCIVGGALLGLLGHDPNGTVEGVPLLLRHVGALLLAVGWVVAMVALGGTLYRRLGGGDDPPLAASLALGIAVTGTFFLAIGAVGVLRTVGVTTVIAIIFPAPSLGEFKKLRLGGVPIMAAVGLLAGLLTLVSLGPVVDWDALTYHLRVPEQFLATRGIAVPEDNLHAAFIGTLHFAALPILELGSPSAVTFFLMLSSVIALLSLPQLLPEGYREQGGAWALLLVLATPIFLVVAATPRLDAAILLFLIPAHALLLGSGARGDRSTLLIAGVLIGAGGGAKLHALVYGTGIVITWMVMARWQGRTIPEIAKGLATISVAAAVAWAPWAIRSIWQFGGPLYPFGTSFVLEGWLDPMVTSGVGIAGLDLSFTEILAAARRPFSLWLAVTDPGALMLELEAGLLRWSPLLLLAPIGAWMVRRQSVAILLPGAFYLAVLLGVSPETNLRYLVPLLPALAALAAVPAVFVLRDRTPQVRGVVAIVWAALALFPMIPWARASFAAPLPAYLVGGMSEREARLASPVPHVAALARMAQAVDSLTPHDARLLFLFESRGLWFTRTVVADTRLGNWPILAQLDRGEGCAIVDGFTHVVLNAGSVNYYLQRGASREAMYLSHFDRFAGRCLRPVLNSGGIILFAVGPRPTP